ncbi:MAG: hypothetical protein AAF675_05220 [Pseudomonadota bacterium]
MNSYASGQDVWRAQLMSTLTVMVMALMLFNTFQWSDLVPEGRPYGTSVVTLLIYLFSSVLDPKVSVVVGIILAIVALIVIGMKVRPILRTAFSPSYRFDTIMNVVMFVGVLTILPAAIIWASSDSWPTNWHFYANTLFVGLVGALYFSGKTHGATQFAETRTRVTDSIEDDGSGDNNP